MTPPKHILAAVSDLFFTAKLQAMAKQAGAELTLVKSVQDLSWREGKTYDALVVELESKSFDPLDLLKEMTRLWPSVEKWGFAGHARAELLQAARRWGCDHALSKGVFESRFPRFLSGSAAPPPP